MSGHGAYIELVVRVKEAIIDEISETETKRLHQIKISSKQNGITLSIELPDVLCQLMKPKERIDIIIDSEPISKGEGAKFYAKGRVFKINTDPNFEMVGTIGGLRMVLVLAKPTPSQLKTFEDQVFHIALL